MTWFRLDDAFALHAKVITAGNAAVGLWVRAACWSASQLTDGRIPVTVAKTLGTHKEALALEAAGLWHRDGDHWLIPDWLEYQPSAAQVREQQRAKSEAKARAGRIGGLRSGEARMKQTGSNDEANRQANGKRNEAPTRPDPTPTIDSPPPPQVRSGEPSGGGGPADPYTTTLELLVDVEQEREGNRITHVGPWRAKVRTRIDNELEEPLREALADGFTPHEIAAAARNQTALVRRRNVEADHARSAAAGHLLVEQDPYIAYRTAMESYPDQHDAIVAEIAARVPGWPVPAQQSATVTAIRGTQ